MNRKINKLIFTILLFFLFCLHDACSFEEQIVLGLQDNWKDFISLSHIVKKEGKWGTYDLILEDAEKHVTKNTDILIHFNSRHLFDETGNYKITSDNAMIHKKDYVYGNGSGLFEQNMHTIYITPTDGALFKTGTLWGDFTLQFWMKPHTLGDSEIILSWTGLRRNNSDLFDQSIRCTLSGRTCHWEFINFFLPVTGKQYKVELSGITPLLPGKWHLHMIRYNSTNGLLEYLVDGIPEAVQYTTEDYKEGNSVNLPYIGNLLPGELRIGEYFTGLIDEFSITEEFADNTVMGKYAGIIGKGITRAFDTRHTGSFFTKISATYMKPDETEIYFYYRTADILHLWNELDTEWIQFQPGETFNDTVRGRYIQILVELYPDGAYSKTPALSRITVVYEPDLPPPPPPDIVAVPGNQKVILTWQPVNYQDVAGYEIYFGERPGYYNGKNSIHGDSPIDVGNINKFEITGLENGKIYYFTIVAYDNSPIPHKSIFSKEVYARPSGLLQ